MGLKIQQDILKMKGYQNSNYFMQLHNCFTLYLEKHGSFFLVVCPCKQREIDFHQQR
jgi:hypothetical protein